MEEDLGHSSEHKPAQAPSARLDPLPISERARVRRLLVCAIVGLTEGLLAGLEHAANQTSHWTLGLLAATSLGACYYLLGLRSELRAPEPEDSTKRRMP